MVQSDLSSLAMSDNEEYLIKVIRHLETTGPMGCSANGGYGLLALLAESLFALTADEQWREAGCRYLSQGVTLLSSERLSTSLYRSAPGLGWVIGRLSPSLQFRDGLELVVSLTSTYSQLLKRQQPIGFDLINGLAGLAVFARVAPEPYRSQLLDQVWENLCRISANNAGFRWITPGTADAGADLGIAHGITGVIAALAAAVVDGWDNPAAAAAAVRGGHWLRAQRLGNHAGGGFPYKVGETVNARLGWCYGAPSVAICFAWLSALDPAFLSDTIACANMSESIRGSPFHAMRDACVCHGTGGWAYIGTRMMEFFRAVHGAPIVLPSVAADTWSIPLQTNRFSDGTIPHQLDTGAVVYDTLLEGAPGVALALAGLQSRACRHWEGFMLLDFPDFRNEEHVV